MAAKVSLTSYLHFFPFLTLPEKDCPAGSISLSLTHVVYRWFHGAPNGKDKVLIIFPAHILLPPCRPPYLPIGDYHLVDVPLLLHRSRVYLSPSLFPFSPSSPIGVPSPRLFQLDSKCTGPNPNTSAPSLDDPFHRPILVFRCVSFPVPPSLCLESFFRTIFCPPACIPCLRY